MIPQRYLPRGFNLRGFPANLPRMHHLVKTRGYKPPWLYNPPVVIHCIDYLMGNVLLLMVSIIHASYHKVNMIMVNKIIEIDTTKTDTKMSVFLRISNCISALN